MKLPRATGVLIHPSQLAGFPGRGNIGPASRELVDLLSAAGVGLWQMLPLGPPGYGGSPYAARSAFAADTALIDLWQLVEDGLLQSSDLEDAPSWPEGQIALEAEAWLLERVRRAARAFLADADPAARAELAAFRERQRYWLEDYCLFEAIKERHDGRAYWEWERGLKRCLPTALAERREQLAPAADEFAVAQLLFQRQWDALRSYAAARGVRLFGDLPIFVARDSADVWSRPELFELDAAGEPRVVAGVPPDDFSEDGQLWGNPLYDWAVHARSGYAWWIARVARAYELTDYVRIDHFRGFAGYWEVPAHAATAREGRWVDGPRLPLFEAMKQELGELPLIAEDLGEITDDVTELLEQTGFPGMKILQFGYYDDDAQHPFRPENYPEEAVVYTGTHDNQTSAGWFAGLDDATRGRASLRAEDPVGDLIERALASRAGLAILPAQDLLRLDDAARTNTPGVAEGNWVWRLQPGQLDEQALAQLKQLNAAHGRQLFERPA